MGLLKCGCRSRCCWNYIAPSNRYSTFRTPPTVAYDENPSGMFSSMSNPRSSTRRPTMSASITSASSIHPRIRFSVTSNRNRYHRPRSKSRSVDVSFSVASSPSKFDNPTTVPPHPPFTHVQCDSPTGNVIAAKKSFPSSRAASNRISYPVFGNAPAHVTPVIRPFPSVNTPSFTVTGPCPGNAATFQPCSEAPSNIAFHSVPIATQQTIATISIGFIMRPL